MITAMNIDADSLIKDLSEDPKVSPELAKRIIDNLQARNLDIEMLNSVIWEIKEKISEDALIAKLDKTTDQEIGAAIDEMLGDWWNNYSSKEILSEIVLSEEFSEDKKYELITTAKQTDHRYWDFEFSKSDLEIKEPFSWPNPGSNSPNTESKLSDTNMVPREHIWKKNS